MSEAARSKRIFRIWKNLSIQAKLIMAFLVTYALVFLVNVVLFININIMIGEIDQVYNSNLRLNKLSETVLGMHTNITEYLNTKSSDAINSYFSMVQDATAQLAQMNSKTLGNEVLIMEKNIRNMTKKYIELTNETEQHKRGRRIEKYRESYDAASMLFTDINECINSLNNQQFKINTRNYERLVESLQYFELMSIAILIFASFASIVLIMILITRSITRPLKRLAGAADELAGGNLDVALVEFESRDEIGVVAKAFNQMVLSIRAYIDRIRVNLENENTLKEHELIMQGHLKDAQLKYLQAQINPHFLFNTLNAGAQLAMMEGAEKTCLFIENMADFLRYTVKMLNQAATIGEELELVDNYMYVLNTRFSGEIVFTKQIEEQWLMTKVPSMILQPIVENSVHFTSGREAGARRIALSVFKREEHICMRVQDNGVGMDADTIALVLSGAEKEADFSKNSTGIGLGNVINRLKLFYNREDVIEIYSAGLDMGTEVIIRIPIGFAE